MNIIIAGDGKVGATLTRQLTGEGYDVTVIDSKLQRLEAVSYTHLDVYKRQSPGWPVRR